MNEIEKTKAFFTEFLKRLESNTPNHSLVSMIRLALEDTRLKNEEDLAKDIMFKYEALSSDQKQLSEHYKTLSESYKILLELVHISNNQNLFKNGETLLLAALTKNKTNLIDFLFELHLVSPDEKNNDGDNALLVSASLGHIELFEYLLKKYSVCFKLTDHNRYGSNAFHIAAWYGKIEMMEHFLKAKYFNMTDTNNEHNNVLGCAAMNDQIFAVNFLLNKGAVVDPILLSSQSFNKKSSTYKIVSNADKLLKLAEKDNKKGFEEILSALGLAINGTRIRDGNTALHIALEQGNIDVPFVLKLLRSANLEIVNTDRKTVLDLLNDRPHLKSFALLCQAKQIFENNKDNFVSENDSLDLSEGKADLFSGMGSKEEKEMRESQPTSKKALIIDAKLKDLINEGTKLLTEIVPTEYEFVYYRWGTFLSTPNNHPINAKKARDILLMIKENAKFYVRSQKIVFKLELEKKCVAENKPVNVRTDSLSLDASDSTMSDIEPNIDISDSDRELYDLNTHSVKESLKEHLNIPDVFKHGLAAKIEGPVIQKLLNEHFFTKGHEMQFFKGFTDVPSQIEFIKKMKESHQTLSRIDVKSLKEENAELELKKLELKKKIEELKQKAENASLWAANKRLRVDSGAKSVDQIEKSDFSEPSDGSKKRKRSP